MFGTGLLFIGIFNSYKPALDFLAWDNYMEQEAVIIDIAVYMSSYLKGGAKHIILLQVISGHTLL